MTTEEATAQGSNSCICLSIEARSASPVEDSRIPSNNNRNSHYIQKQDVPFSGQIIKLSREAEHPNFKLFPLASVSILHGKLSFFSHKATSIQSINDHCK